MASAINVTVTMRSSTKEQQRGPDRPAAIGMGTIMFDYITILPFRQSRLDAARDPYLLIPGLAADPN